jgi:phosphotransacetylase
MMLALCEVDGLVSGAVHSTAHSIEKNTASDARVLVVPELLG